MAELANKRRGYRASTHKDKKSGLLTLFLFLEKQYTITGGEGDRGCQNYHTMSLPIRDTQAGCSLPNSQFRVACQSNT
jgi:hypothetical protein